MSQVTVLTGAVWGIVGAIAMVVIMQARGGEAPPPFAVFWAKFIGGGNPSEAMPQSLILHFTYAAAAGAVYVLIFNGFNLGFPITGFTGGVIWGIVWAAVLMIGAMVQANLILDMDPQPPQVVTMGLAHLVYGLVIGILSAAVPHLL